MEMNCFLVEQERWDWTSVLYVDIFVEVREAPSNLVEAIIKTDRNYSIIISS